MAFEEFERTCESCGEENPPDFPVCWNCHADLSALVQGHGPTSDTAADAHQVHEKTDPWATRPLDKNLRLVFEIVAVLSLLWLPGVLGGIGLWIYPPDPTHQWTSWYDWLHWTWVGDWFWRAGGILLIAYLAWREEPPSRFFGLQRPGIGREVPWGLALGLVPITAIAVMAYALPGLPSFPRNAQPLPQGAAYSMATVPSMFLVALEEEMLFRSYLWRRFNDLINDPVLALLVSSALFSAAHVASPATSTWLFLMGVAYGWVFIKTGCLWRLVIGHWLYDLFVTLS